MIGNSQGFSLVLPGSGALALAALKPISMGSNPVTIQAQKPWSLPDAHPEVVQQAIAKAIGGVVEKAGAGYEKYKADKKADDKYITALGNADAKQELEWSKHNETIRHNKELEQAARARIKGTTPADSSDSDEFWGALGFARPPGRVSETDDEEVDQDYESEQPAGLSLSDVEVPDQGVSLSGDAPLKLGVDVKDIRMQRDAKPNPGLRSPDYKSPIAEQGSVSQDTQAQLAEIQGPPPKVETAAPVVAKPVPKAVEQTNALAGLAPIQMSEAQKQALLTQPAIPPTFAPRTAPVTQAIQQASQQPVLSGMQLPGPGVRPIAGLSQANIPAFVSQKDAPKALWLINNWERLGGNPDVIPKKLLPVNKQGQVQIDWENVAQHNREQRVREEEHKLKQEEMKQKAATASAAKTATISMREGNAVSSSDDMKNYTNRSGLRQGLRKFIPAYFSQQQHPEASGPADIDLMDTYARSMTGNGITEGQAHLIVQSRSLKDKLKVLAMKPEGGDVLSQGQRDQMLRTMLEAHNSAANAANSVLDTARDRMIKEGVKDESYLPQLFVDDMMLKKDAEVEKIRLKEEADKLILQRRRAIAAGNKEEAAAMEPEIERMLKEGAELQSRLVKEKYSGNPVLGYHHFKAKKQGFVAGTGGFNLGHKDSD